jgi:cold shock protein
MSMAELQRGIVKWFNDAKGFGFIEHETGRDVFVHYSVIESEGFKTLKDGEEVEYELREGDKGLNASRVVRVNPPATGKKAAASQPRTVASMIEVEKTESPEADEDLIQAEEGASIPSKSLEH